MLADTSSLQTVLDVCGVFVFALSGALVAARHGLDLFGILVLAWVAGLGGGIIRDLFLGVTPPVAVSDWRLLAAAVVAGSAVFLLHGVWERLPAGRERRTATSSTSGLRSRFEESGGRRHVSRAVRLLDAAGLALFAVSGALVALSRDAGPLAAVLIGGITAVGGGVLRDVLAREVPEVLQRELYALPALAGAAVVVGLDAAGLLSTPTAWAAVAFVFVIRVVAVVLDLNAPRSLRGEHAA